jgi:hypothetical protein
MKVYVHRYQFEGVLVELILPHNNLIEVGDLISIEEIEIEPIRIEHAILDAVVVYFSYRGKERSVIVDKSNLEK